MSRLTGVLRGVPVVVAAAAVAAPAARAPFTEAPAGLREEVVLAGTSVAGGRLDLNRFVDERSAETLHEAVRRLWSRRQAPVHSDKRDGWLILTQVVGAAVETFEVQARGAGSHGRRSRLSRDDHTSRGEQSSWLEATLPEGSRRIDSVTHTDAGRRMTTLVALTPVSATAASREVVASLVSRGFRPATLRPAALAGRGLATFLSRGAEEIAVTVSEHDGQRAVVMHWGRTIR